MATLITERPPMRAPDGRAVYVTSQSRWRNPEREDHVGVDVNGEWFDSDPDWDGFRDKKGNRKWVSPPGSMAIAVDSGKVVGINKQTGVLVLTMDKYPGYLQRHKHLDISPDSFLVDKGWEVVRGQDLAKIGETGTDVPHSHFEVRRQVEGIYPPVDPMYVLNDAPLAEPAPLPAAPAEKGNAVWILLAIALLLTS